MGSIVSIFDNSKYFEKNDNKILLVQNIINDINSDITNVISGLNSFIDTISYYEDDDNNIQDLNDKINDLEEFKKEINNIDFSSYDIDNLLYRLHIMLEISHKDFLYRFKNNFSLIDFDEIVLFHTNNMVSIYINSMNNTLKSNFLSHDYNADIEDIKSFINDSCNNAYLDSKRKVYYLSLYDLISKSFPNDTLSNEEKEYLDSLVEDTVNTFINYRYVDIRNYFIDILFCITDGNMFRLNIVDLNNKNKKDIEKKISSYKLYYLTLENVRKCKSFFMNECIPLDNRNILEDNFDFIEEQVTRKDDNLNSFINKNVSKLNGRIMNLVTEALDSNKNIVTLILEYLNDELEIDRIIRFSNSFKDKVLNYDNNKTFDFDKCFLESKSKSILDRLYDVIRKEIFNGKDKEFYSNIKYGNKLNDMIIYISNNPNYLNYRSNNSNLIDDFNIALAMLKGGLILENRARELGLDMILEDINNLDYRDYNYTSNYIVSLKDIIDESNVMERYCYMKEELSKIKKKKR